MKLTLDLTPVQWSNICTALYKAEDEWWRMATRPGWSFMKNHAKAARDALSTIEAAIMLQLSHAEAGTADLEDEGAA